MADNYRDDFVDAKFRGLKVALRTLGSDNMNYPYPCIMYHTPYQCPILLSHQPCSKNVHKSVSRVEMKLTWSDRKCLNYGHDRKTEFGLMRSLSLYFISMALFISFNLHLQSLILILFCPSSAKA